MSQGRRGQAQLHPNMRVKLEPDGGGGTPPVTQPYPNDGIGKALTVTNGLEGIHKDGDVVI